ncbi:MAG: hypothetical protein H6715_03380 [Myxococcales bacterium]|nr:hypothetical protein [Myxococcales bacterium]MCB9708889.1 hypothetical protein [Myxococcales bacterium]
MRNVIPLKPAHPDVQGPVPAYGPKIPWRIVVPILSLLLLLGGGYWLRRERQLDHHRSELKAAHASLDFVAERYRALRQRLDAWILEAATRPNAPYLDPRLHIERLHKGKGLYLRIPLKAARTQQSLLHAVQTASADSIPSCLGVSPGSVSDLYAKGNFLMPSWIERVDHTRNPVRLRVMDDELRRRARRDLPRVADLLKSDWFMLVLQHGENRRDNPVDVHIWGLRPTTHLLSTTIQADGMLVTAHNDINGRAPSRPQSEVKVGRGAANDCSIAAQLQKL